MSCLGRVLVSDPPAEAALDGAHRRVVGARMSCMRDSLDGVRPQSAHGRRACIDPKGEMWDNARTTLREGCRVSPRKVPYGARSWEISYGL